jgi:hypothetical protein
MREIDAAIAYHLSELIRLRRLHNTHASVNSLPPELLSLSFALLLEDSSLDGGAYAWALLTVSSVCAYWRSTSLQDGSLWRTLKAHQNLKPELVELMLGRTKDLPLIVTLPNGSSVRHIALLLDHLRRIKSLTIVRPGAWHTSFLLGPAPLLESFTFQGEFGGVTKLEGLFANGAPRLRSATFKTCILYPEWTFLADLSSLTLHCPLPDPEGRTLIELLGRATALRYLRIYLKANLVCSAPVADIELPRLQEFELECRPHVATFLLSHISCPQLMRLRLIWRTWWLSSTADVDLLLRSPLVSAHLNRWAPHLQELRAGQTKPLTHFIWLRTNVEGEWRAVFRFMIIYHSEAEREKSGKASHPAINCCVSHISKLGFPLESIRMKLRLADYAVWSDLLRASSATLRNVLVGQFCHPRALRVLIEVLDDGSCLAPGLSQVIVCTWIRIPKWDYVKALKDMLRVRLARSTQPPEIQVRSCTTLSVQDLQSIRAAGAPRLTITPWKGEVPDSLENVVVTLGGLVLS